MSWGVLFLFFPAFIFAADRASSPETKNEGTAQRHSVQEDKLSGSEEGFNAAGPQERLTLPPAFSSSTRRTSQSDLGTPIQSEVKSNKEAESDADRDESLQKAGELQASTGVPGQSSARAKSPGMAELEGNRGRRSSRETLVRPAIVLTPALSEDEEYFSGSQSVGHERRRRPIPILPRKTLQDYSSRERRKSVQGLAGELMEDESSDSEGSHLRVPSARGRSHRRAAERAREDKDASLQVVRTAQLLNILLKQQNLQALNQLWPRDAKIDPTKLALSYEDLLAKVKQRRPTKAEDRSTAREEQGLSWAAALILTIPPSLLAILLAHHIAKRQLDPGRRSEPRGSRYNVAAGDFDVDSESSYSTDNELARAEGESVSFGAYNVGHPAIIRKSHRALKGTSPSMGLPDPRWRGGFQHEYSMAMPDHLPRQFPDAFDQRYTDTAYRRKTSAYAPPLPREFAELEDARSFAWAGDSRGAQDLRMHGGL